MSDDNEEYLNNLIKRATLGDELHSDVRRLLAENAALKAEVERLTKEREDFGVFTSETLQERTEQIAALTAENAQLRVDAERLDWWEASISIKGEPMPVRAAIDKARGYANQNTSASEEPPMPVKEECRIKDACPYKRAIEDALMLGDMSSSGSAREDLNRLLCAAEDSAANQIKMDALRAECENWKRSANNLADTVKMLAAHKPSV